MRLAALILLALSASDAAASEVGSFEYLGIATLPTATQFEGTEVGGLSGITWDEELGLYYSLSDDPGRRGPSRFYTLALDLKKDAVAIDLRGVTVLTDRSGEPFAKWVIDGEGIALTSDRTLLISSEGNVQRGIAPSIREITVDGRERHEFHVPSQWLPREGEAHGVRHNNAFEALTLDSDGEAYVFATENALEQDGPETAVDQGSRVRIARFHRKSGRDMSEYVYEIEPVVAPPPAPDAFHTNGLVELVSLDPYRFLALERSFTLGVGNSIRLYLVDTEGATDVRGLRRLEDGRDVHPASKRLLVNFDNLGFALDNVEGMTLGPILPDGRRALVLVSDNNFSPLQITQVLAFALDMGETPIAAIQGAAHRSPLEGRWIRETSGIVTATDLDGRRKGFWMQDDAGDDDPRTSEGLFISAAEIDASVAVGDRVSVGGRVVERERTGQLPITRLEAHRVETLAREQALPEATNLGDLPTVVDDDGLSEFQPEGDAIDRLESVEGMRVEVGDSTVVGPTTRFGTLSVARPSTDAQRTSRGGLLLQAGDVNSERLVIDGSLIGGLPPLEVGRRLEEPLVGVLDYSFGSYRLVATAPIEAEPVAVATLDDAPIYLQRLDVASFNAENLDLRDSQEKFDRVAAQIAKRSPDVAALQEIQDDSGTEDDGTVSAAGTLERLVGAIREQSGRAYAVAQIDPDNNADGGAPGGNIRVAFLYDSGQLELLSQGSRLGDSNPARLFEDHPAFLRNEETGFEATRKPLAAEFEFRGERVVMINVHLKSKRGDDAFFGAAQPPLPHTEEQRRAQTRALADYVDSLDEGHVVLLGDFNDHEFRSPLTELTDRGWVNLIDQVPENQRYTYNFEGNSQVLDHILISPSLASCDPWTSILHVNADLPHPLRASDHDPVFASFDLGCSLE